jgi:hypothetical protein
MVALSNVHPQPWCHKHHAQMMKVLPAAIPGEAEVYSCGEPGCNTHYCLSKGYCDLVRGELISSGLQRLCSHDGSPMYFAGSSDEAGAEIWYCSRPNCQGQEVIDTEIVTLPSDELMGE